MIRGATIVETEGRITISRVSSTIEDDYISIEIRDKISGTEVAHVKMSMNSFAQAITAHGSIPVSLRIFQSQNHGNKLETCRLPVIVETASFDKEENFKRLQKAAGEYIAKDGWILDESDWNSRNYNYQTKQYHASFYRHVEVTE